MMKRSTMSDKLDAAGVHGSARTILLAEMDDAGMPWEEEEPASAERLYFLAGAMLNPNLPPAWVISMYSNCVGLRESEARAAVELYGRRVSIQTVIREMRYPTYTGGIGLSILARWADMLEGGDGGAPVSRRRQEEDKL